MTKLLGIRSEAHFELCGKNRAISRPVASRLG